MSKIIIKNVKYLDRFLKSITKFVPSCKFDIDADKCSVRSQNVSARAFFTTNVITSESEISFCLSDLTKLYQSIKTLADFKEDDSDCVINYDGTFLRMKDIVSFKLTTVKEDVVRDTVTSDIKTQLKPVFGFKLRNAIMNKMNSMQFMSQDSTPKVYIYKQKIKGKDVIIGEIDNKVQQLVDSISIPLSNSFFGEWETSIITDLDSFGLWNPLTADDINVSFVTNGTAKAIISLSEIKEDDVYVKAKVLSSVLKQ